MSREKSLQRAQKALDGGSPNQRRGAAEAYLSILKTLDSVEFSF
jgi:hypothetical protein